MRPSESSNLRPADPVRSLGSRLRTVRESKGLSFRDVEAVTRIRARHLEALETGDYGALPGGDPQVRGFLRRYASFLGLSPEEVIAWYEQETGWEAAPGGMVARRPPPAAEIPISPSPWRGLQVAGAVVLVVLLALVGFWLVNRSQWPFARGSQPGSATSPPFPSPAFTPIATTSLTPPARPTFPVAATRGVTLTLEPLEHVWVRVTVDGYTAFEGMLAPPDSQTWTATEMVVVETGNGAGLIAVVNGQSQGPIGGRGEVCARGWGLQGELDLPPPPMATPAAETASP